MDSSRAKSSNYPDIQRKLRATFICALIYTVFSGLAAAPSSAAVVWAVGDGAGPGDNDLLVASMIETNDLDNLLYLGDVYDTGTAAQFTTHYQPSYGRFKEITYPVPGNHEWDNRDTGYFPYWSSRINGAPYYSATVGGWRILALNSETDYGSGGSQVSWLRSQLAANPGTCNIGLSHKPRYSAGTHGDQEQIDPLWQELKGKAAINLSGHDHNYQRIDRADGTTQFVVGTGGADLYVFADFTYLGLQAYDMTNFGALRLDLTPGRAAYGFRTTTGAVVDQGTIGCQVPAGSDPGPGEQKSLSLSVKPKPKRQRLGYALKRGIRLKIACNLSCTVSTKLKVSRAIRSKRGRGATKRSKRRRTVILGKKAWKLEGSLSKIGRIKVKRRERGYLKRRSRITVKIVAKAKDSTGNTVRKSASVTLSRPG